MRAKKGKILLLIVWDAGNPMESNFPMNFLFSSQFSCASDAKKFRDKTEKK
jgi:hypothetical protein